jgi:hypothetical protein
MLTTGPRSLSERSLGESRLRLDTHRTHQQHQWRLLLLMFSANQTKPGTSTARTVRRRRIKQSRPGLQRTLQSAITTETQGVHSQLETNFKARRLHGKRRSSKHRHTSQKTKKMATRAGIYKPCTPNSCSSGSGPAPTNNGR